MIVKKNTKIIATIGPATESRLRIKQLISSGVNVFRFNTKHSDLKWHTEKIKLVKDLSKNKNISIMIDIQGPEIRIETKEKKEILLKKNTIINISNSFNKNNSIAIINDKNIFNKIKKNNKILIGDGLIILKVIEKKGKNIKAMVVRGGILKDRNTINFPEINIELKSLIKRDLSFLDLAKKFEISFIALSFVSSAKDIEVLRKELAYRKINASIVAKIETKNSIENINEIINSSDCVMVARGDLGIEVPVGEIAYHQKRIIEESRKQRKPVIVATQMLYSMKDNPKPTRAEATDVSNAILDGCDAVMLSEETAIGSYPIESVKEMTKILQFNEKKIKLVKLSRETNSTPTDFIVEAILDKIQKNELNIKSFIVFTESGYTARIISSFRKDIKIIAITDKKESFLNLSISYGVQPIYYKQNFHNLDFVLNELKLNKILLKKDVVAVFHGRHEKKPEILSLFSLIKIK
jgi:pyruvate kinase